MILFDGCSWTYGDELENREQDAFPHVVSRMGLMREGITRDHVNLGQSVRWANLQKLLPSPALVAVSLLRLVERPWLLLVGDSDTAFRKIF